jgi:hypothetical protein
LEPGSDADGHTIGDLLPHCANEYDCLWSVDSFGQPWRSGATARKRTAGQLHRLDENSTQHQQ